MTRTEVAPRATNVEPAPPPERQGEFLITALIAVGLFCFYLTVQRQIVPSYDGQIMLSVARNLVAHGSLMSDRAVDVFHTNTPYSTYGIGMSLFLVPFVAIQGTTRVDGGAWVTLANPIILAAAGAVLYRLGLALGWARIWAVAAALAFGLLTFAPSQSTELFSEPAVTLCTLVALLGCVRLQAGDSKFAPWMIGIAIGISFLFRSDSIVLVASILLFLPLFKKMRDLLRSPWILVGLIAPILVAGAFQGWYNDLRFGSITSFGYPGGAYGNGLSSFSTPLFTGLAELLRWPHKGFFWFNPLLLTALPGFIWLARRNRAIAVTILGMTIIRLLVYAKWFVPSGGIGWGPRLLFPLCATLMIPAAETWQRIVRLRGFTRLALGAVVLALALSAAALTVVSVWVPYEQAWNEISHPHPGETQALVDQRIDDYKHSIRGGPIAANVHLLERAARFPLWHFEGGPDSTGVVAAGLALVGCAGAGFAARRADRRSPRRTAPSAA